MRIDRSYIFTFGKHGGEEIEQVLESNPGYVLWCAENIKWFELDEDILDEAERLARSARSESRFIRDTLMETIAEEQAEIDGDADEAWDGPGCIFSPGDD